jgi:hypothetical protein
MKKIIILSTLILLFGLLLASASYFLKETPKNELHQIPLKDVNLSASIPKTYNVEELGSTVIGDKNIELIISRALFETDPSRTGGDRCLPPPKDAPLTEIGALDNKTIFRGQRVGASNYEYFAKDTSQTCYLMPIFTKKFPEFDNISVNFTFKSPDLSDLEKQKYTQIADQIVLSLKDTAKK